MSKRIVPALLLATFAACKGDKEPDAYGNFEAEEVVVSAEMGGQLEWFTPVEGMRLAANATVGLIDSTQTALEIQQAIAQREGIRSRLGEASQNINVLTVQRTIAERNYARMRRLFSQRAATAQQLDQAERDYRVLNAQIQAAQAQRQTVGEDVRATDARIAQIRDRQSKAKVINPRAGTVLATYTKAGEVVASGKPLYKIANLDTMTLRAYITADELAKTRLGQTVQVHIDQSDGKLMTLPGTVTWIASKAEFTPTPIQTRDQRTDLVYAVKVRVPNRDGILKIGMPADLELSAAPSSRAAAPVSGQPFDFATETRKRRVSFFGTARGTQASGAVQKETILCFCVSVAKRAPAPTIHAEIENA
jgi:HlyD family secretion protein